jgi:GNAT superfamily N-acetyltransferase
VDWSAPEPVGYRSEPLDPDRHTLANLNSGEPELDSWLREHASGAQARRVARTFVWVDSAGHPDLVVGYYSLTGHRLMRDALPKSVDRGSPVEIPAVLLARLALDQAHQGTGNGGALLADALGRIVVATQTVAARFVVVDAVHERAATFYEHYGFRRIPQTLRLVQKVSDIAAAMDDL